MANTNQYTNACNSPLNLQKCLYLFKKTLYQIWSFEFWHDTTVFLDFLVVYHFVNDSIIHSFTGAEVLRPSDIPSDLFYWFTNVPCQQLNLNTKSGSKFYTRRNSLPPQLFMGNYHKTTKFNAWKHLSHRIDIFFPVQSIQGWLDVEVQVCTDIRVEK